jgi:hypothetical protein
MGYNSAVTMEGIAVGDVEKALDAFRNAFS